MNKRHGKHHLSGVVFHFEKSAVIDNTGATDFPLFIGHTTMYYRYLMKTLCYAVVRKLARLAGVVINSFDETIQGEGATETANSASIRFGYRKRLGDSGTTVKFTVSAGTTWGGLADEFETQIEATFDETTDALYTWQFTFIELEQIDATSYASIRASKIRATDATINLVASSRMVLQNRTVASSAAGS